jgi:hypothetical protein
MGVIVNDGDKLTPEEKARLLKLNQKKYGLSREYVHYLRLPKSSNIKVYSIDKIINARRKLTTAQKIGHLVDIKVALLKKLAIINSNPGVKLRDFDFLSPQEFEAELEKNAGEKPKMALVGRNEETSSSGEENEDLIYGRLRRRPQPDEIENRLRRKRLYKDVV